MSDIQIRIGYVNGVGNLAVIQEITSERESSILMYFCNKLQGEKNLISRKNFSTGKENHSFPTGRE